MLFGGQPARVEAGDRAGELHDVRLRQAEAVEAQPAGQLARAEALGVGAVPALGVEAGRVHRLPERIAGHPAIECDRELEDQAIETAASHASRWRARATRDVFRLVALLALACAGPGARTPVPSDRLAVLANRVEVARELRFRGPVAAESVTPEGVPALLEAELDRTTPPGQLLREEALAKALGLLPPGADLRAILLRWQSQAVAGFYSPAGQRLFVVEGAGAAGGNEEGGVLVHELAHALQDQQTRLLEARIGIQSNDDLQFALGAFLEGDALWTELRDEAATSGFPQSTGAEFASRFAVDAPEGADVPRILRESFLGQYPLGYGLASELVERGGVAALTAALADPPLSSEELMHRERYLVPSARRPLALFPEPADAFAPESGCEPVASSSYGELGVGVWLREGGVPDADAARAADGWDGDRAWRLDCARGAVVAWLIQLDTEHDARELEAAALRTGWTARAGLAGPLGIERSGLRVLLYAGIEPAGREALLVRVQPVRYAGMSALLRNEPEILERAERQRSAAR